MVRISDARMSGTAFDTIVLHVYPEAAVDGPLALGRAGDRIRPSAAEHRLDLLAAENEFARRRQTLHRPAPAPCRGHAKPYMDHVIQAGDCCDLDFLRSVRGDRRRR